MISLPKSQDILTYLRTDKLLEKLHLLLLPDILRYQSLDLQSRGKTLKHRVSRTKLFTDKQSARADGKP